MSSNPTSQFCIDPGDKRCNRAAPRYPSKVAASCVSFMCGTCGGRFGQCRGEKDSNGNLCDGCWQKREDKRAKRKPKQGKRA